MKNLYSQALNVSLEGWFSGLRMKAVTPIDVSKLSNVKMDALRKYPDLLLALDKWVDVPDMSLITELRDLGKIIQKLYGFNKPIRLYRGFDVNTTAPQETLGLSERRFFRDKVKDFSVGDSFSHINSKTPVSFTPLLEIAKCFGDIVVETNIDPNKQSLLIMTDELATLVCERRNIKPETQKEVIILPPYDINFTVIEK